MSDYNSEYDDENKELLVTATTIFIAVVFTLFVVYNRTMSNQDSCQKGDGITRWDGKRMVCQIYADEKWIDEEEDNYIYYQK